MKHTASSGQGQVLRSSDSGSTWSLGYDVRPLLHPGRDRLDVGPDSGEGQLVQLYDNATLFYELRVDTAMPCEDPAVPHCRLTALSDDGGKTCASNTLRPDGPSDRFHQVEEPAVRGGAAISGDEGRSRTLAAAEGADLRRLHG